MKIVEPSYEILIHPDQEEHDDVLKYIEKIGRTCYKSEDKITAESAPKFINMLRDRGHWAMLEHFRFVLRANYTMFDLLEVLETTERFDFPSLRTFTRFIEYTINNPEYPEDENGNEAEQVTVFSFSITTINNVLREISNRIDEFTDTTELAAIYYIAYFMNVNYPELIVIDELTQKIFNSFTEYDYSVISSIGFACFIDDDSFPKHEWQTVKFTCSRGFSHECVRHRPASYAQSSTRYCNYSKGQFGSELNIIDIRKTLDTLPEEADKEEIYQVWKASCEDIEEAYMAMINLGAAPQIARSVLPNSLMTEVNMTATLEEWHHFFKMRADKPAHPEMKQLAVPLLKEFITLFPGVFDDLEYRLEENKEYLPEVKNEQSV